MYAEKDKAAIAIEIAHPDAGIQELFFDQFKQFKTILKSYLGEEWDWQLHTTGQYGKTVSRVVKEIEGVNVFNTNDWPQLISFFKPRVIALDEFWSDAKYSFEALR